MERVENKDKLTGLFTYIKELYAQKYQVVTDIKKQDWYTFLDEIPTDDDNIQFHYVDRTEEKSEEELTDNNYILSVTKPEFTVCPKPPTSLIGWLSSGWDKYTNVARYIEYKEVGEKEEGKQSRFVDDNKRVTDYTSWIKARDYWVSEQGKIDATRKFFNDLYMNYVNLERESETIEFMVGQGLLSENTKYNDTFHPILLKRLRIDFDPSRNRLSIIDTNVESDIYTMLLQGIDYINHGIIKKLKEELDQEYYHPLDRVETPKYLKGFIHLLHQDSKYIESEKDEYDNNEKIVMYDRPVFFVRKKISGVVKALEDIIEQIGTDEVISGPLLNLIGDNATPFDVEVHTSDLSQNLAALSGEDRDILLSKEANREQLEIARRIEMYNAVLVQGPPGTGKTHTIANLMGHFLAQGKSLLVTSHTKKALSVVKEKVPKALQNLCVTVLEDNNQDMERSVDGITEYISAHSALELFEKSEKIKRKRLDILDQLSDVRKKIFAIKHREYEAIIFGGKSYSVAESATFVSDHAEDCSYIPGKVTLYKPLPVTVGDLELLYKTNEQISVNEEIELSNQLPNPAILLSPAVFEKDVSRLAELESEVEVLKQELNRKITIDADNAEVYLEGASLWSKGTEEKLAELQTFIADLDSLDEWALYAVIDGKKGGGFKTVWENLIKNIQDTAALAESTVEKTIGKKVTLNNALPHESLMSVVKDIQEHLQTGKKISKLNLFFHKPWKEIIETVQINGKCISSSEDCGVVCDTITLNQMRSKIAVLWNELITKNGGVEFTLLGDNPEQICMKRIPKINQALNWYSDTFAEIKAKTLDAKFNIKNLFEIQEFNSEIEELKHLVTITTEKIPIYIQLIKVTCFEMKEINASIDKNRVLLREGKLEDSAICKELVFSIDERNVADYKDTFTALDEFYTKYYSLKERVRILQAIEEFAPDWANHIKNRIGIHGANTIPNNIEDAWLWKQFSGIIDDITSEPFESLQHKSVTLNIELRKATANLSENLAWYHLLNRIEDDIDKKQALQGWKLTQKKIGKGTGKKAPLLKREAQKLMTKCQSAVPAWIMPVNKALESLDSKNNKFDIVIIDEASQSDISALAIMYLAKKIIIVGDDEQVSPSAIGIDVDKTRALSEMYIKGNIPNWHLFDMNSSLYDIAKTTFPILMLKEHFRCVPEIIGYSNQLSYDYKIKPLRDGSSSPLKPPTVSYHVDGVRNGASKVNDAEAENVIALMLSCMEQPEYAGMTFGAISLLGDQQAKKINNLALEKLDPKEYFNRAFLCGNASQFQGDERDVIFLSMVDSNEGEGPLRLTGEGIGKSTKQRYNVAASRARNQLWVVHSIDVSNDLKSGDMRRDLITYAANPNSILEKTKIVNAQSESPFETAVGRNLVAKGYHIIPQWKVGSYRIDMVAVSGDGKVAIECDGERYHSGNDKVLEDMERQTILERLGWRFIRIRGSEYYRNPQSTIERVISELDQYGIDPEDFKEDTEVILNYSDLFERVKIGSDRILGEWEKSRELAWK